jgi:hypothetical protein
MTPLSQSGIVTTGPPLAAAIAVDTFDTRWDNWLAKGNRRDRRFHKRAKIALVALTWAAAIVTVWLVVT